MLRFLTVPPETLVKNGRQWHFRLDAPYPIDISGIGILMERNCSGEFVPHTLVASFAIEVCVELG